MKPAPDARALAWLDAQAVAKLDRNVFRAVGVRLDDPSVGGEGGAQYGAG